MKKGTENTETEKSTLPEEDKRKDSGKNPAFATQDEKMGEGKAAPGDNEAVSTDAKAANTVETADEKSVDAEKAPDPQKRIAELERLNADLQDQYLRKAADFDNYRKRMIREKQEAIEFANTGLLVDLVQILDDFDRAIEAGGSHEAGTPAAAFADGIKMIRNQLGTMLETKYGLTYYPAKGEHFDPNIHEAIGKTSSADVQEPIVAEEFVKGYKLKDRVIRLSKVMVAMPVAADA